LMLGPMGQRYVARDGEKLYNTPCQKRQGNCLKPG
jgi:hypothetical protein